MSNCDNTSWKHWLKFWGLRMSENVIVKGTAVVATVKVKAESAAEVKVAAAEVKVKAVAAVKAEVKVAAVEGGMARSFRAHFLQGKWVLAKL